MAYDINAALERLERNLSEVDSAKKQVEETIATSESLQQIVGRYSDSLDSLNKEVSKFIGEVHNYQSLKTSELDSAIVKIKSSCEGVIAKFNSDVKCSTDVFNEKFTEAVTKFSSENSKLSEQVNKLSSLHDALNKATGEVKEIENKLDVIAKDLKDSQSEQDKSLASIKSSIDSLPGSIKTQIDAVANSIDEHAKDLNNIASEIKSNSVSANQKLDSIISILSETKTICNGIRSDIAELRNSMDSGMSDIGSAININRWLIIIGVIILVALHFVK